MELSKYQEGRICEINREPNVNMHPELRQTPRAGIEREPLAMEESQTGRFVGPQVGNNRWKGGKM